jgi:hypothetical protein
MSERTIRFWLSVGLVASLAGLSPLSSAQTPTKTTTNKAPAPLPQSCNGEANLRIVLSTSKNMMLQTVKFVSHHRTEFRATGAVTKDIGPNARACTEKSVVFSTEDPEMAAALRTCATMAALMPAGSKLMVDVKMDSSDNQGGSTLFSRGPLHVVGCREGS